MTTSSFNANDYIVESNYIVASAEDSFNALGWGKQGEVFTEELRQFFDTLLKVPQALVDNDDSVNWVTIWNYLDSRSYGNERKRQIVDLINTNRLDTVSPDDFINN
jgi:hypothetical protein